MTQLVPFEEAQKAAAEAFGKEVAQNIFGFLSDITRPPAKELGGLLADHIKLYRLKTQLKVIRKAQKLHEENNIQHQQIPLRIVAHLFDSCSWEEDDWMQTRWATLLANAATLGEKLDNYSTHVEILRQLSPLQVRCLDIMYSEKEYPARLYSRSLPSYQYESRLRKDLAVSKEDFRILCESLIRLNLIQPKLVYEKDSWTYPEDKVYRDLGEVSLTYLGQDLVKKCRIPFSKAHIERLRGIFTPVIDEIAKDHKGKHFHSFIKDAQAIYEHIDDQDIKSAVWGALKRTIWKGSQIKEFEGESLSDQQREEIIKDTLDELERTHS